MFFCENCRYIFDITKDLEYFQKGGKIDDKIVNVINKFKTGEEIKNTDVKGVRKHHVYNSPDYDKMNKKDKKNLKLILEEVDDRFADENLEDDPVGAHFICKYCGNHKVLRPGTMIYSRTINKNNIAQTEDYSFMIHDPTLPRTKNYICQYDECETHKNPNLKEAVISHNNLGQAVYICHQCENHWINAI